MKTKAIFGFMVAALIALFAINFALAATGDLPVSNIETNVNDVDLVEGTAVILAGSPSETVPVAVVFTAAEDLEDLRVKVWIDGYKSDISASTARFDVINGSTYIKKLALTLPEVFDMDALDEELTVYVRISNKDSSIEVPYTIRLQKETYSYNVLSVDAPSSASAGDTIALDVVLKNTGLNEMEDTFVVASIPELGISKKAYFGDLDAEDACEDGCNEVDAKERRIFLTIPADVESGEYVMEIKAYNYDITETVKKVVNVKGVDSTDDSDTDGNSTTDTTKTKVPTSIVVLTIVLVVIFVVLLIVLIVLLTKKPSEKSEDFGETSYY